MFLFSLFDEKINDLISLVDDLFFKTIDRMNLLDKTCFFYYMCYRFLKDDLNNIFNENKEFLKVRKKLFEYTSVIDNKLDKYLRFSKQLPKNLKLNIPYYSENKENIKQYDIPYENYINLITSTLYQDDYLSGEIIGYFYKKNLSQFKNNFKLTFYDNFDTVEFLYGDTKSFLKNDKTFIKILYNIIDKNLKNSRFQIVEIIIDYKTESHYNVALLEKTPELILMSYYEPHGNFATKKNEKLQDFLKNLIEISNYKLIITKSKEVGYQTLSKDTIGYCFLFGLFWINMVLSIIKFNLSVDSYIPSNEWIFLVEEYYINKMNESNLYKVIITFTTNLINGFFASRNKNQLEKISKTFIQMTEKYINEKKLEVKEVKEIKNLEEEIKNSEQISYTKKEFEEERKKSPELLYEDWEKEEKKELYEYKDALTYLVNKKLVEYWNKYIHTKGYKQSGDKIILGKRIGNYCEDDKDCFSNYCRKDKNDKKENICYPKKYRI
jgi:hypothetical protein